jgi:long-subunit acyl-CoA synthetase (AMP-forming)
MITSLGRNISPEWLERELLAQPEIGQAVAFGDGRPHPIALLVPSRPGLEPAALAAAVEAANARLPESARVRRWEVVRSPFTAADGSLTANGRPKRDVIAARYAAEIDSLFEQALAS